MAGEAKSVRHVFDTSEEIADFVFKTIRDVAKESISERKIFTLGVSGGSIINILATKLSKHKDEIEWSKWKIFFCDERLSDFSDPDSTYGQYKKNLIDVVGHEDSWVKIDPALTVEKCAEDYEEKVKKEFGGDCLPSFDMLLLGMGPDGHTCSLFPGHDLLKEETRIIAPINDSPKPPPCRVTMTLPVLNNSKNAMFISAGSSKAETIKKVFSNMDPPLPASLVKPKAGKLIWVMDKAAASSYEYASM